MLVADALGPLHDHWWRGAAGPLVAARIRRLLHVGAATVVLGAVAGMYLRGLGFQYRATWESTFLGADTVQSLLGVVLGPAARLLGVEVPSVAPLEEGSGDAALWIHLYAVTAVVWVVLPRALLAWVESRRCAELVTGLSVNLEIGYFRRLLAPDAGDSVRVAVVPYSHRLEASGRGHAEGTAARRVRGPRHGGHLDAVVEYGDDAADDAADDVTPGAAPDDDGRRLVRVALFGLGQSPESEVHGRFAQELKAVPGRPRSACSCSWTAPRSGSVWGSGGAWTNAGRPGTVFVRETDLSVGAPGSAASGSTLTSWARSAARCGLPRAGLERMTGRQVTMSLVSHTNVGKTTLARTLLRRDVGEVLDQAHVTEVSEAHTLIESDGRRLVLWDTPGFGDTARLVRRLKRRMGDPLGWFLHQVWDRVTDRPLWCGQEAARNVQQDADVVLYLVPSHRGAGGCRIRRTRDAAACVAGQAGARAAEPDRRGRPS